MLGDELAVGIDRDKLAADTDHIFRRIGEPAHSDCSGPVHWDIADLSLVDHTKSRAHDGCTVNAYRFGDQRQFLRLRFIEAAAIIINPEGVEQIARSIRARLPLRKAVGIGCDDCEWRRISD